MKFFKKVLITIAIIVVIIVIIVLVNKAINKKVSDETNKVDEQLLQESIENYSEGKVFPRGIAELTIKYEGQNDKNDLYRSLNYITKEYIPSLFKDLKGLKEEGIKDFFSKNENAIEENLGINKEEDFVKLAKYLQENNYEDSNFEYCEIDSNTYRTAGKNKYFTFIMNFKYENHEEPLKLRVYFANMTSTNPTIIYAKAE